MLIGVHWKSRHLYLWQRVQEHIENEAMRIVVHTEQIANLPERKTDDFICQFVIIINDTLAISSDTLLVYNYDLGNKK